MISPPPILSSNFLAFRAASSPRPSPRPHAPPPLYASFPRTAASAPEPAASLYDVLDLSEGASPVEIKAAYRRLARAAHPDARSAAPAPAEDFIRVHAAYSTLSDPGKRADYDRQLLSRRRAPVLGMSPSFPRYYRRSRRTWETDQCW